MSNNISGKQQTFLDLIKDDKIIVIPIIQRDYAQGRDDSKAKNIREKFVKQLFDYLKNDGENELDFIYAIEENGKMVIIDGQQRLTTLFLLHWYLGGGNGLKNESNNKSKFYYETRASSTAFCNALVANNCADILKKIPNKSDKDADDSNEMSQQIAKERWFFLRWKNDPTIASMLNMLDTIHSQFKNTDKSELYKKLKDKRVISFQFLSLENMGSSEDMYTRMNARGEPLTGFENFKAGLIKYLEEKDIQPNDFSLKMDTTWSDYFFDMKNKLKKGEEETVSWDDIARNIIHNFTINDAILFKKGDLDKKQSDDLANFDLVQDYSYFTLDLITSFTNFMDAICALSYDESKIYRPLKDDFYKWFKSTKLIYAERLRLFAFSLYLAKYEDLSDLDNWIRVVYNLTENTTYDTMSQFIRDLESIDSKIKAKPLDILADLASNTWTGFSHAVREEEQLKAKLIKHGIKYDVKWQETLTDAEQHGYFKGQIGFILHLSGISYVNIEEADVAKFNRNYKIASQIFNDDGLNKDIIKEYRWERALLCFGDYRIFNTYERGSFLKNNDRDISWKRLLREFNDNRFDSVRKVFQNINNSDDVYQSLDIIIENNKSSSPIDDRLRIFIEEPRMFGYWENYGNSNRYLRDNRFLISKSLMSSKHAEVYSRLFYLTHNDKEPEQKYWYYESSKSEYDELPSVCLWYPNFTLYVAHDGTKYEAAIIHIKDEYKVAVETLWRKITVGEDTKKIGTSKEVDDLIAKIKEWGILL